MRVELPVLSFLSLPLVLLPLPWHLRARNVATLTIIFVLFWLNLFHGINSIVWAGSVVVKYRVWCDIAAKFDIGASVALPAATLCIAKHLESVASIRRTVTTADDKRRRTIFELCFCVLFPCIIMALHYVVQGHRFDIAEDIGCMATTYWSWPAFFVVYFPPMVLCFATIVLSGMAFRWFLLRRAQFAEHLQSCNSGLTAGRYMRLMAMALSEVVLGSIIGGYVIGRQIIEVEWRVWDNWAHVHVNFSRIAQHPRVLTPDWAWNRLLLNYYIVPLHSLLFFIFFGFGQEAVAEYRKVWLFIRTRVLRLPPPVNNESVLPTYSGPRNASNNDSSRVVKLRNFDNLSIDEKWDDEDAADHSSNSVKAPPASSRASTDASSIPRPLSTPPSASSSSMASDSPRRISLDLPRLSKSGA